MASLTRAVLRSGDRFVLIFEIVKFAVTADADASEKPSKSGSKPDISPMFVQYFEIKEAHPDCLLFYRMGDFYELFFEDAVVAAAALDITLTKRGQHNGDGIPMCGVPHHASEAYLLRLIRQGHRVAICEQTESPVEAKKRGSKSVVRREVVRIVTPGTLTEEQLLDARSNNYLAAMAETRGEVGIAWVDVSTGDFQVQPLLEAALPAALARIGPSEVLVPERMLQLPGLFETFGDWKDAINPMPNSRFDSDNGKRRLEELHEVGALDGFGAFGRAELAAAGALVDYLELTQKGRIPRLSPPRRWREGGMVEIDPATRRNLEISRTLSGERRGSLLSVIDRTITGAGARLLASYLGAPLTDPQAIEARLDTVGHFVALERLRQDAREILKRIPDLERALSRLALDRGGPRDLAAVRDALSATGEVRELLTRKDASMAAMADDPPEGIRAIDTDLGYHPALVDRFARALLAEPPLLARDGGFVAPGYAPELDQLRTLRDESRRLIANLQNRYVKESGISALKIRHNNVLGYFIEVTALHAEKMIGDERFIHRQTMANAARFSTVELGELERELAQAADKALAVEQGIFADLVGEVMARDAEISRAASALARLDLAAGMAELAVVARYCRPKVDAGLALEITGGRHPVVEALMPSDGGDFVANDCDLAPEQRLWLITGPNMAGKSTFLRQNALIVLLAQIGSYVPADSAHIGVVDRLFSRVGAADDLARGRSTFMVEMVETAAILNQATERSLVILDEIGRGTATFDGLSIAWATIEHLHEGNACRTLFATHYHELTALAARLPSLACYTMRIKEWRDEVVFLHEVAAGAADRSYGIHVARLAGLPAAVLSRAEEVLTQLESGDQANAAAKLADDLPLFQAMMEARPSPRAAAGPSAVEARLAEISPDELTPRAALDLLYELRGLAFKSD